MPDRLAFAISGHPVFTADGVPRAKGRARAVARVVIDHGRPRAVVSLVTPPETRQAEAAIRAAFKHKFPGHKPWTGPVLLRFTAVFETPRSFNRALREAAARGDLMATRKPDKDNIEKLIVDALNGVAFVDDAQVMGGGMKRYGSPARLEISFEQIARPDGLQTPGHRRTDKRQAALPFHAQPRPAAHHVEGEALKRPAGPSAGPDRPSRQPSRQPSPEPRQSYPAKAGSRAAIPLGDDKPPADLTAYTPRQRALIEAALARDEAAKRERGG